MEINCADVCFLSVSFLNVCNNLHLILLRLVLIKKKFNRFFSKS